MGYPHDSAQTTESTGPARFGENLGGRLKKIGSTVEAPMRHPVGDAGPQMVPHVCFMGEDGIASKALLSGIKSQGWQEPAPCGQKQAN